MLQPRLINGKGNSGLSASSEEAMDISGRTSAASSRAAKKMCVFAAFFIVLLNANIALCKDIDTEPIDVSRIRRDTGPAEHGNQKKAGRYINVKPVIGLLTSTARTFIQDGVTTEYATQILGTTLDNGRIYAQVLTKSSLILYSNPSNPQPGEDIRPTRLPTGFDGQWNVKQDLGFIDPEKFVLKNTDYLSPQNSKLFTVFASKPSRAEFTKYWNPTPDFEVEAETEPTTTEELPQRIQPVKEIPRYSENEAFNLLDGPTEEEKKPTPNYYPLVDRFETTQRNSKALNFIEPKPKYVEENIKQEVVKKENVAIVKPNANLPTFTIKNEFSPIFYYIDNFEGKSSPSSPTPSKTPKKLFGNKHENHPPKKTFTYAGFADFTTVVGDTVIVFTPNTNIPEKPSEVKVEIAPTPSSELNIPDPTRITSLKEAPVVNPTYQLNIPTVPPPTPEIEVVTESERKDKALFNDEVHLNNVLYENTTPEPIQTIEEIKEVPEEISLMLPDGMIIQNVENRFGLNADVIQPSESVYTTILQTQLTDEVQEVVTEMSINSVATDPLATISPSERIKDTTSPSEVTTPEEVQTTPEMEPQVTTEESVTGNDDFIEVTENLTTTESLSESSDESNDNSEEGEREEEIDTDDERELIIKTHPEDATCTDGIVPVSTETTAFKTLTYLTTYFIPLEGTETTTSVKSNVVVESNTGFLTNFVCKTQMPSIEPSVVETPKISPTIESSLESKTEDTTERKIEPLTPATPEPTTKPTTIEPKTNKPTTQQEIVEDTSPPAEVTHSEVSSSSQKPDTTTSTTTTPKTTTTEQTTTESRTEVTITTEPTEPTTLKIKEVDETPEPPKSVEDADNSENEIDLIFKTLYTTYTYFTTYFGPSTSSVASHKSVVTNVITSTLDLAQIDPSLLDLFEASDYLIKDNFKDEIAPTSVGIGRPTESFAINSLIDLVQHRDLIESVQNERDYNSQTPTPELSDDTIKPDVVKTYLTTYTFFTTIYVGEDANVCSRSEVYTNYVGPDSLIPTKTNTVEVKPTKKTEFDFRNCKQVPTAKRVPEKEVESEIKEESDELDVDKYHTYSSIVRNPNTELPIDTTPVEVDMLFSVSPETHIDDSTYVTDVKSSSSKGDKQIIDNNVLDDQISSESNIDEIRPSPTLLLQTSYTTFTYFTTMYIGKDSSKVKSRLETITNVVTETLEPKGNAEPEESNLPITYYTTFTYWTTLYKDKTTTTTSREEIISNVVTPSAQAATVSPIDTSPIEISTIEPNDKLEVEIKPSVIADDLAQEDDGKATFYTTYTYFTTYYAGNSSQIRSSLETVTNIVDNTKDPTNDNQLARAVGKDPSGNNLIKDDLEKVPIVPTVITDVIQPTKIDNSETISPTVLVGTYIDNLFAEVQPAPPVVSEDLDKKIISSQVAVITGDSTIITHESGVVTEGTVIMEKPTTSTTEETTENLSSITSPAPTVIESSVPELTTPSEIEQSESEEDDDGGNTRKKSRLTFPQRKRTFTPVIRPFASRNRPTFSPKRVALISSATTITRSDFTPTITATPALKNSKSIGFGSNRKQSSVLSAAPGGRRFAGRGNGPPSSAYNSPAPARASAFGRGRSSSLDIQPTARRSGFRSSQQRGNSLESANRAGNRIRPTPSSRFRGNRLTSSILPVQNEELPTTVTESETSATQDVEAITDLEETSEPNIRKTTNPLLRFRKPIARIPGTAVTPRSTTQATTKKSSFGRTRNVPTTRAPPRTQKPNALFSRNRPRPNALFPPRGLLNKPEPQKEEEVNEDQEVDEEEDEELLEDEFEVDNDYDSSDIQEEQVTTTTTTKPFNNRPIIRPFVGFRRRTKRQTDYGSRKYSNFRRPGQRTSIGNRRTEPEPETPPPPPPPTTPKSRTVSRYNGRANYHTTTHRAPAATTEKPAKPSRQPFILRGESRTPAPSPSYRTRTSRPSGRTTTSGSRPKAPRLKTYNTNTESSRPSKTTARSSSRSRSRSSSRSNSRNRQVQDPVTENNHVINRLPNDGKITITHHLPSEVTIPVVNGKITEYKNVLTAKPSIEILPTNQVSTSIGPLGIQQLVLLSDSTELGDNGVTKLVRFLLHETPTTTVLFTPTTIRGRKTSFSHVVPSTVYSVEYVTSTLTPEINANVPLANILLSQLLLGNVGQQAQLNPLLALQGQQQAVAQTPVTEFKTKTTTYVTTVTDAKSTILPLTFRGKEILTTIVDSSTSVITATEFITETVVTTPTAFLPQQNNQLNSLLLPLLLQQQQQQQQQQLLQTPNPLLGLQGDFNQLNQNQFSPSNDLYHSPKPEVLDITNNNDDAYVDDSIEDERPATPPPKRRSRPKAHKPAPPPRQSSIVTLYVSGRTPGEFSTVLSTVYADDTQTVKKREVAYYDQIEVRPSQLPDIKEIYTSQIDSELDGLLMPAFDAGFESHSFENQLETQSLESIVGEVSKYISIERPNTILAQLTNPTVVPITRESQVDAIS